MKNKHSGVEFLEECTKNVSFSSFYLLGFSVPCLDNHKLGFNSVVFDLIVFRCYPAEPERRWRFASLFGKHSTRRKYHDLLIEHPTT